MEEIDIREATEADAGDVHRLLGALAGGLGKDEIFRSRPEDIAAALSGPHPAIRAILARRGGEAVGIAVFYDEFSTWRGRRGVYVQDLYLDPATRGTGLGRALLAAVARLAGRDTAFLRLAAHLENTGAAAFYRHLGFAPSEEEVLYLEGDALAALRRARGMVGISANLDIS